jgi:hypothetical protein
MKKSLETVTGSGELVPLLNEHQVSNMLGVSVRSLRRWRLLRRGPRFRKLGSASVDTQNRPLMDT